MMRPAQSKVKKHLTAYAIQAIFSLYGAEELRS